MGVPREFRVVPPTTSLGADDIWRRLEYHIQNTPLAVTEWDKEFRLLYWSPQAENVFGWRASEIVGKNPYEFGFVHEDDAPHVKGLIQRMTSGGERRSVSSNRNYDQQGNVHYCEWYNSALTDENGELRSILCIALDVTQRIRTEQELRASQERLRQAQRAALAGAWEWNIISGAVHWSDELFELYGVQPGECATEVDRMLTFVHPDDRAHTSREFQEAVTRCEDLNTEFRIVRPNGEIRWMNAKGKMFYGANLRAVRMVGVTMDVTDRVRLIEELRAREQRLMLAHRAVRMGAWTWDIASGAMDWGSELWAVYGVDPDTLEPSMAEWLNRIFDDDRAFVRSQLDQALTTGRELNVDFRCQWPDGSMHFVRALGRCSYNENGKPLYLYGICMDATERRRSEELLRATDRLAATAKMAGSLAHEINNPLAAVTNVLYLLRQEDLSPAAKDYVTMANTELARVAGITRSILGLYRETPQPVSTSLSDVMRNVLLPHAAPDQGRQLEVLTDFQTEAHILGYPGELRQLFSNLVDNAIEAMGRSGTLKIRIRAAASGALGERGVRVLIADHGPGIRSEIRERIFDPFFTTKGERGTGLGLWIAGQIVRKHGGTLRVRTSTTGNTGTVFNVFLPCEPPVAVRNGAGE